MIFDNYFHPSFSLHLGPFKIIVWTLFDYDLQKWVALGIKYLGSQQVCTVRCSGGFVSNIHAFIQNDCLR